MEFRNKKRWRQNPLEGYLVGFIGFALAFVIRQQLQGSLDDALPTFFFTIATIIVAARYGLWPALFTIVLSLPTSLFFFREALRYIRNADISRWADDCLFQLSDAAGIHCYRVVAPQ